MALIGIDWEIETGLELQSEQTIIDVIKVPSHIGGEESNGEQKVVTMSFPGIFTNQPLVKPCASPDDKYILLTTQWGSVSKVVKINLDQ